MKQYLKKLIELPENILFDVENLISNIKNETKFAYQRLFRGYDDRWYWCIKDEITPILIDCLNFYKKQKEGYPCDFKTREEWLKVIDTMIDGFKAGRDLDYVGHNFENSKDMVKEYKRLYKIKNKGMKLFAKYYDYFWN
jgi:hypothetical protein